MIQQMLDIRHAQPGFVQPVDRVVNRFGQNILMLALAQDTHALLVFGDVD